MASTAEAKFELITRRLQEVLGGETIKAILDEGRTPKCYFGKYNLPQKVAKILIANAGCIGTACTGRRMYTVER